MKNNKRDTYAKNTLKSLLNRIKPGYLKKQRQKQYLAKYNRANEAEFHVAFVLDGIVEDIIHCDERLGILLLSEPDIIKITNLTEVGLDWRYNKKTGKFYEES